MYLKAFFLHVLFNILPLNHLGTAVCYSQSVLQNPFGICIFMNVMKIDHNHLLISHNHDKDTLHFFCVALLLALVTPFRVGLGCPSLLRRQGQHTASTQCLGLGALVVCGVTLIVERYCE